VLTTGNSSRVRQALGLVDALHRLDSLTRRTPSTILAGDLNTWSLREGALRMLRRAFPDSPDPLREPTRGPFPTDHLFYRGAPSRAPVMAAESYQRVGSTWHSDHYPVTVRLLFPSR
jgi:endonuclease/exonuclease/phosphatase (EEP) superfamily protein YafD